MNKYHNRNRIISPIMTIHDILTLHILSSFLPSLFLLSLSVSFFLSFPFSPSLSFSLPFFFPFSFPFSFSPSPFSPLSSLSSLFPSSLPLCFLCLLS